MIDNYFPKNTNEYYYYFNIESFILAKESNETRMNVMKSYKVYFLDKQDDFYEFINKSELLDELLSKIITSQDIETLDEFYSSNNTCILLNCNIENFINNRLIKKNNKKKIGRKGLREISQKTESAGNILYPDTLFISTILHHFPKLLVLMWIISSLYFCTQVSITEFGFLGALVVMICIFSFQFLPIFFINKVMFLFRQSHLNRIKSEFSYKHQYKNKDFWADVFESRVKKQ